MSESELEQLIKDWYQGLGAEGEELRLAPTADCPPLTRLWRHVAEGHPLEEYADHVAECGRCRRVCEIIKREHARAAIAPPAAGRRAFRPMYAAGGLLAAAACIALLVISWPQPSFDTKIAAFLDEACAIPMSPVPSA